MKVYLAAPWSHKGDAMRAADLLEAAGHTITEKWWLHREAPGYLVNDDDNDELRYQAEMDLEGVAEAGVFILLNLEKSEGKAVETGFALALDVPIVIVGRPSNIFHYLDDVDYADSIEEVVLDLDTWGFPWQTARTA